MTFFLNEATDLSAAKPRGTGISTFTDGLGAAFNKASLENDANFRLMRERRKEKEGIAGKAISLIGGNMAADELQKRGLYTDGMLPGEAVRANPKAADAIIEIARAKAAADPKAWEGIDLSDEGVEDRINKRLQAEHADAEQILNNMPGGRAMAEFAGGMAGVTADVKNLPFMFMGGGGSILRVMGREAAINMAAEAAFIPSQYEMADRLEIPDPDIPTQLAMAAGAGAVIGGGVEAITRAARYAAWRRRMPVTADPVFDAHAVDAAEDAIVAGEDPFEAAQRVRDEAPPPPDGSAPEAPQRREPLILTDPILTRGAPDGSAPEAPPETVTEAVAEAPPVKEEAVTEAVGLSEEDHINQSADQALSEAMAEDRGALKPLITFMRNSHRVRKSDIRAAEKAGRAPPTGGANFQVKPDGAAGKELKAMGVTPKSAPGLFSKAGRDDFDNLVASEMEEQFPGIMDATGTPYGSDYLDRQGFLDLIRRDADGDSTWLRNRADAAKIEAERDAALRAIERGETSPAEDFLSGKESDDGFFVDLNVYEFDGGTGADGIAADFDEYLARKWQGVTITEHERAEILRELQNRGGDARYLVERLLERELNYGDYPIERADDYGQYDHEEYNRFLDQSEAGRIPEAGERDLGEPPEDTDPTRRSSEGEGRDRGAEGAPAAVDGSGQLTIPGTDRVDTGQAQRDRATIEARSKQSKIGRLDQTRVEDDPGGLFGGAQMDIFSDPLSPESRAMQDAILSDVKDKIEANGDFPIDTLDSKGVRPASSVLEELDLDEDFQDILDSCGKPGGAK